MKDDNKQLEPLKFIFSPEDLSRSLEALVQNEEMLKRSSDAFASVGQVYQNLINNALPSIQEVQQNLATTLKPAIEAVIKSAQQNLAATLKPIIEEINNNALQATQAFLQIQKVSTLYHSVYSKEISSLSSVLSEFTKGIVSDRLAFPLLSFEQSQTQEAHEYALHQLKFIKEAEWVVGIRRIIKNGLKKHLPKRTIVHQLISLSRGEDFVRIIEASLLEVPEIKKRKHLIMDAVNAHAERRYNLSVPIFLIQIEGMITDCLLARKIAIRGKDDKSKIHVRTKSNRPGNELKGLEDKVNRLSNRSDAIVLEKQSRIHVATDIRKLRNSILHGTSCAYGKPLVSLQMLMLCLGLLCIFDSVRNDG